MNKRKYIAAGAGLGMIFGYAIWTPGIGLVLGAAIALIMYAALQKRKIER